MGEKKAVKWAAVSWGLGRWVGGRTYRQGASHAPLLFLVLWIVPSTTRKDDSIEVLEREAVGGVIPHSFHITEASFPPICFHRLIEDERGFGRG